MKKKLIYDSLWPRDKLMSLVEEENITEELKANDMMLWVQKMNNNLAIE